MSIRSHNVELVRAYAAWWFHSCRCMWKGHLGVFGYDKRDALILIACTCGRMFWVRS